MSAYSQFVMLSARWAVSSMLRSFLVMPHLYLYKNLVSSSSKKSGVLLWFADFVELLEPEVEKRCSS